MQAAVKRVQQSDSRVATVISRTQPAICHDNEIAQSSCVPVAEGFSSDFVSCAWHQYLESDYLLVRLFSTVQACVRLNSLNAIVAPNVRTQSKTET